MDREMREAAQTVVAAALVGAARWNVALAAVDLGGTSTPVPVSP